MEKRLKIRDIIKNLSIIKVLLIYKGSFNFDFDFSIQDWFLKYNEALFVNQNYKSCK